MRMSKITQYDRFNGIMAKVTMEILTSQKQIDRFRFDDHF